MSPAVLDLLRQHAVETARMLDRTLDERAAQRLLDVHLDPRHFAMPVHGLADEQALLAWCRGSAALDEAHRCLHFEPTRSLTGVVRVLARTHINRQGVGEVTRAARWKVQSPRVVGLFSADDGDAQVRRWRDHRLLVDDWLALAVRWRDAGTPAEQRFEAADIDALEALRRLSPDQAARVTVAQVPGLARRGWGRVVLGLHTGVLYLERRFAFDPVRLWAAVDAATSAGAVAALADEARAAVTEFGPALSASFFADLGSAQFVKGDVHVTDVVGAATGAQPGAEAAVAAVRTLAAAGGLLPRQVDKLMYLACSGKFYLAGLKPPKQLADQRKRALMAALRSLPG